MSKRAFRLCTVGLHDGQRVVVLTCNLQDVQPWKQKTPCYRTTVYRADACGLPTGAALTSPVEHPTEEQARREHTAIVGGLRRQASA